MGIFILDLEKPQTTRSRLCAAAANIELYLEELKHGNKYDHLITSFAKGYLDEAIKDIAT